ncbi:hypothetical protein Tco_0370983 [Tanacetum coccineum]
MAQPQRLADVHQDELCPPKKCYALMDANKKIDPDNPLYPNASKIMKNIIQNHPLRFSIAALTSVSWIYLGRIFHLPHATDNNHERFVVAPKFLDMVPFFLNTLGFTLELRSPSNFKTTRLLQPWKTLGKIFALCLTTRVTSHDQPPLEIMQMLYCFVNNIHVDNVELLWEGLHYALKNPSTPIPYPRFTKLIVGHYMTAFPEISQRARDKYHNLEGDAMVHYRMYDVVFRVDVATTSQQTDCVYPGTGIGSRLSLPRERIGQLAPLGHLTLKSTVIRLHTLQLSLAEQKSHEELEAKENEERVKEHLMVEEIDKLVEGTKNAENVEIDSSILRNDDNQTDPDTRLETRSDKESLKVELTAAEQSVNVNEEEEESAEDDYESPRIYSTLISSDTEKRQELTVNAPPPSSSTPSSSSSKISDTNSLLSLLKPKTGRFKRYKSFFDELQGTYGYLFGHLKRRGLSWKEKRIDSSVRNYMSGHILHVHPTQATPTSTQEQQHQLYLTMKDNPQLKQDDLPIWLALKYKFERLQVDTTPCRPSVIRPRDQDDPHDDAHPEGDNSAKRQKTSEHETFVFEESSSGQDYESEPGPSTSGNQEQSDDFNFWSNSYATDDDVLPNEKVSQELVDEISRTIDEAKLRKVVDEMLRQQCTSGDVHQYHIDQMQNFLKNLLYLKKGNTGPEKMVLSLHKSHAVRSPDDDIEERTSK